MVRPLEALPVLLVEGFERVVLRIAEVLHKVPEVLEVLRGRLEEGGTVTMLLKEGREALGGYAARPGFGYLLDEVRLDAAVNRDDSFGGARHGRVGPLDEEAAPGQFLKEGCGLQVLVVRRRRARPGRLQVDKDDVTLLGTWGFLNAHPLSLRQCSRSGSAGSRSCASRLTERAAVLP